MAARLGFCPRSLTVSQWLDCPGFWNRMLWYRSPGVVPPIWMKISRDRLRNGAACRLRGGRDEVEGRIHHEEDGSHRDHEQPGQNPDVEAAKGPLGCLFHGWSQ